jgi:ankyrin repeat protein
MGFHGLLVVSFVSFMGSVLSLAIAMLATTWLAFDHAAAYAASAILVLLMGASFGAILFLLVYVSYYLVQGKKAAPKESIEKWEKKEKSISDSFNWGKARLEGETGNDSQRSDYRPIPRGVFFAMTEDTWHSRMTLKVMLALGDALDDRARHGGYTPLMWAACYSNKSAARKLLQMGADPNATSDTGLSSLFFADKADMIRLLLEYGADPNLALISASRIGDVKLIEDIATSKRWNADVFAMDQIKGRNALHWAAVFCQPEAVQKLLDIRKDKEGKSEYANSEDREGFTALHLAVLSDKLEDKEEPREIEDAKKMIDDLKKAGANLGQANGPGGRTALIYASEFSRLELVKHFLKELPEDDTSILNAVDKDGETALHIAVRTVHTTKHEEHSNVSLEIIKILLEKGIDSGQPNNIGQTALHLACLVGSPEAAEMIIDKAEKRLLNAQDKHGRTPLHVAAEDYFGHNFKTVELLCNLEVNAVCKDYNGDTPLILAAQQGAVEIVKKLLKDESVVANINHQNRKGETALQAALEYESLSKPMENRRWDEQDHSRVMNQLREHGALDDDSLDEDYTGEASSDKESLDSESSQEEDEISENLSCDAENLTNNEARKKKTICGAEKLTIEEARKELESTRDKLRKMLRDSMAPYVEVIRQRETFDKLLEGELELCSHIRVLSSPSERCAFDNMSPHEPGRRLSNQHHSTRTAEFSPPQSRPQTPEVIQRQSNRSTSNDSTPLRVPQRLQFDATNDAALELV